MTVRGLWHAGVFMLALLGVGAILPGPSPSLPFTHFADWGAHFRSLHYSCRGQAMRAWVRVDDADYNVFWRAPRMLIIRYGADGQSPDWVWTAEIEADGALTIKRTVPYSDELPEPCQMLRPTFDPDWATDSHI